MASVKPQAKTAKVKLLPSGQRMNWNALSPIDASRTYSVQAGLISGLNQKDGTFAEARENRRLQRLIGYDPSAAIEDSGRSGFERLEDPFWAQSRASFEYIMIKAEFDQPCGDSCGFRRRMTAGPSVREAKKLDRLSDVPDARVPAPAEIQQPSSRAGTGFVYPTKPY